MRATRLLSALVLVGLGSAGTLAPLALERAEQRHEIVLDVEPGASIRVENLIGSVLVEGTASGPATLEALVVAEAKTLEEAEALARAVRLERGAEAHGLRVLPPPDADAGFRFPRSDTTSRIARWVAPLLKRGSFEAEYDGRKVRVGGGKGALPLAVHLRIALPPDTGLRIRQVAGEVECRGLRGRIAVETAQGAVRALQAHGALEVDAGGDVEIKSFRGERLAVRTGGDAVALVDLQVATLELASADGRIRGERVTAADLRVETAAGDVLLEDLESESLRIRTDSGSVEVTTRLRRAREGSIETGSGSVSLRFARLSSFDLRTETREGAVQVRDLPLTLLEQDGGRAHYQYRSGGTALRVATGTGKVTVRSF